MNNFPSEKIDQAITELNNLDKPITEFKLKLKNFLNFNFEASVDLAHFDLIITPFKHFKPKVNLSNKISDYIKNYPPPSTGDHDQEVRNFAYVLWECKILRELFLSLPTGIRIYVLIYILGFNSQEAYALARLDEDDFNVVMKVGRPPGSNLISVEFTILSI